MNINKQKMIRNVLEQHSNGFYMQTQFVILHNRFFAGTHVHVMLKINNHFLVEHFKYIKLLQMILILELIVFKIAKDLIQYLKIK
ncbi:hypothetical protein IMG5_183830 [Ichthyophthirius multifiliis]|uniref:Uncharacterized protein n=1 Tax=Ichthyophthirius multifiliis TaxID=5932 RepID=G0R385_ICHMU|nr:hypothetical protein IMG5_183830 [Ichthyophthirius multifiliis]EGR28059.1 hypothetical protein IMG5_183830 [Ichthyophthirius multifiliis]|eukprot:XP_004027404.1 hypothetical protein IMG5_183830 [Ichthyophthirius multifiliis]